VRTIVQLASFLWAWRQVELGYFLEADYYSLIFSSFPLLSLMMITGYIKLIADEPLHEE